MDDFVSLDDLPTFHGENVPLEDPEILIERLAHHLARLGHPYNSTAWLPKRERKMVESLNIARATRLMLLYVGISHIQSDLFDDNWRAGLPNRKHRNDLYRARILEALPLARLKQLPGSRTAFGDGLEWLLNYCNLVKYHIHKRLDETLDHVIYDFVYDESYKSDLIARQTKIRGLLRELNSQPSSLADPRNVDVDFRRLTEIGGSIEKAGQELAAILNGYMRPALRSTPLATKSRWEGWLYRERACQARHAKLLLKKYFSAIYRSHEKGGSAIAVLTRRDWLRVTNSLCMKAARGPFSPNSPRPGPCSCPRRRGHEPAPRLAFPERNNLAAHLPQYSGHSSSQS